jgi:hypothetical protein
MKSSLSLYLSLSATIPRNPQKTGRKTPGFLGILKVISRSNYILYTMQIDR